MHLPEVVPFILLMVVTLGGLYFGYVTTTEAAAIGGAFSIVLGLIWGNLRMLQFIEACRSTVLFSGNILFIILSAYIFSYAISFAGVGEKVTQWVVSLQLSQIEFFFALFVLFTILGCLMER